MKLFADTETTGVSGKPFIVQLAFIATEDDGTLRSSGNFIIKPEGYSEMPKEASDVHGITFDIAQKCGVPLSVAISAFNNTALNCDTFIAHNLQFDLRMINYAYERGGWPSRLTPLRHFCTMEHLKNKVRIPPTAKMRAAGRNEFKSPKLSEAYEFAFKKPLLNAHDALYDVNACKELYFWLVGPKQADPIMNTPQEIESCMQSSSISMEPLPT